jgi:hypothetical protein
MSTHSSLQEIDPDCCCAVCFDVLVDPVTMPCGHTLNQRCLQLLVAAASDGAGQRACPTCREVLPAVLPSVNIQLRNLVQRHHPIQVRETQAP